MANGDLVIRDSAVSDAPKSTEVSGASDFVLLVVQADIDGSAASSAFLPTLEIVAPGGAVTARVPAPEVAIAGSAEVTWAPFLRSEDEPDLFPLNLGELGFSGSGTQATSYTHTIEFQDVRPGDGILVSVQAPSKSAAGAPLGGATGVFDTLFNNYNRISEHAWEGAPVLVNEGAYQVFFYCPASIGPLVAGVDTITALFSRSLFDRSIYAWVVRHDGGAATPTVLAATADNDAAVFASTQVTLTSPAFTPSRDDGLAFATIFSAKAGGTGGFGGVVGWSGYFQALSRSFTGSKQTYRISPQTYGANALVINPFGSPLYEIDLGELPGGTPVGAFNGVAQNYTAGANAWKGITLFEID